MVSNCNSADKHSKTAVAVDTANLVRQDSMNAMVVQVISTCSALAWSRHQVMRFLTCEKKLGRRRPHNSEDAKDNDDDGDEWIPVKRRRHTLPKRRGTGELINFCPDNLPSRFTHNFTAVFLLDIWWLFEKSWYTTAALIELRLL